MKSNKFAPKKNAAQAIVEFAIVLPILLLLLYGLLEAGRLLFIYSSIVTASRQAARYGSATGLGSDWSSVGGPNNSTIAHYQDCYGIRRAARRADFLKAITNIKIEFVDSSDAVIGNCNTDPGGFTPTDNNSRIKVTVTGHFGAIVPKIVPFFNRDINAMSRRTIVKSVSIKVAGSGAAATTVLLESPPGGTEPSKSQPGEMVTFTATVTSTSGVPKGKVEFYVDNVLVAGCTKNLSGGIATCDMSFAALGIYDMKAVFTPTDASAFQPGEDHWSHQVGASKTNTEIIGVANEPSVIGNPITITVRVSNQVAGGTNPTGTVQVTTAAGNCTITLTSSSGGIGSCTTPGVYNTPTPSTPINASYTPGDPDHLASTAPTYHHEVLSQPPTPSNTPPPTEGPPTAVVTPAPTAVTGCESIANSIGSIKINGKTMTLQLTNTNPYPVTINSVFVAWNYDTGHSPGDSRLFLLSAQLGNNTFWNGSLNQPSALLPLSTTVTIAANSKPTMTFTFDKTYSTPKGEQIHIRFSTPGCENYPVIVPAGSPTITPGPSASLKIQLISGGTDSNTETQFRFQVQNTGSIAVSNISLRIYFTIDGTWAASNYVLEKYWDQSGAATISGPTLASGNIYYFTVDYGTATLAAGSTWEFQTSLHAGYYPAIYDGFNDWWHTASALPVTWTDWPTIPAYVSGSRVWGSQP